MSQLQEGMGNYSEVPIPEGEWQCLIRRARGNVLDVSMALLRFLVNTRHDCVFIPCMPTFEIFMFTFILHVKLIKKFVFFG